MDHKDSKNGKVLVVDDDIRLLELLKKFLEKNDYEVVTSSSSDKAINLIEDGQYFDCIILDVMMPNKDGIYLTKFIKDKNNVAILLLTAMGEAEDRIRGLESGADDYLVKPFEPKELVLRIDNLIRLYKKIKIVTKSNDVVDNNIIKFGEFQFKMKERDLRKMKDNSIINLTSTELDLLHFMCMNIEETVSREQISAILNGISERSIDVQINRLRQKIEKNIKEPILLQTVRGRGYILKSRM